MPSKGRAHFDTYTEQNRVKHAILTKYLGAYLNALRDRVDAFHYIDGFAGAGTYESAHAGSPLYAIELLAKHRKRGTASFVENDPALFAQLEQAVAGTPGLDELLERPLLRRAEFSECVDEILARPILKRCRRTATFAFVDPCGLAGLYLDDLAKILRLPFSECLVFLNYDGLPRWLGAVRARTHARQRLDRFFGSSRAAAEAMECLSSNTPSHGPRLLDIYVTALRQHSGATFVLPFRFKASERNRTSHYLIHLSQHALAFKIMKEVMRSESSETGDYGSLGLIPEDEVTGQGALFRPNADRARDEVVAELRRGAQPVSLFLQEWPLRPHDLLVEKEYRQLLVSLENEAVIEMIDAETGLPAPADKRRKRLGESTLGKRYQVRLLEPPRGRA